MIVYHITFGTRRLQSILKRGLLPATTKVFAEADEDTSGKIFFGRTLAESRNQIDLLNHPVRGDEIHLTIDLPPNYVLYEDEWGYLYGTKPVPPHYIIDHRNLTATMRALIQKEDN